MSPCSTRSRFISSPIASGKLRGGFNNRPGFSLVQLSPQACKHSGNSFVQPLHVCPPCPQTGARHEEHRPPGFPAFHAYGVQ